MAWMKTTLRRRLSEDGEEDKEVKEEDADGGPSDHEDEAGPEDPEDPELGAGEAEKVRNSWTRSVRGWWILRRRWSSSQ